MGDRLSLNVGGNKGKMPLIPQKFTYLRDPTCKIELNRFLRNLYLLPVRRYYRTCKHLISSCQVSRDQSILEFVGIPQLQTTVAAGYGSFQIQCRAIAPQLALTTR